MTANIPIIVVTATKSAWREAKSSGFYRRSSVDQSLEEVGFIHATAPDQTLPMLNRRFQLRDDLVLLFVRVHDVTAPVKFEPAASGRAGLFPHIYGPLNSGAVFATAVPNKGTGGQFMPPAQLTDAIRSTE